MPTAHKVEVFWDKCGKYIKVSRHEDRAYIIRQRGPFILTKPFRGGGLTFSGYSADYRIYRLDKLHGNFAKMLGEFPLKSTALKCFGPLYSEFLSKEIFKWSPFPIITRRAVRGKQK